jgi:hypothetical protein
MPSLYQLEIEQRINAILLGVEYILDELFFMRLELEEGEMPPFDPTINCASDSFMESSSVITSKFPSLCLIFTIHQFYYSAQLCKNGIIVFAIHIIISIVTLFKIQICISKFSLSFSSCSSEPSKLKLCSFKKQHHHSFRHLRSPPHQSLGLRYQTQSPYLGFHSPH